MERGVGLCWTATAAIEGQADSKENATHGAPSDVNPCTILNPYEWFYDWMLLFTHSSLSGQKVMSVYLG